MKNTDFETQIINMSDYLSNSAKMLTRDEENAKDLAQETVIRALENYDKYKKDTNLKGWLKVMMRNIFINGIRKKSNQTTTYDSDDYRVMIGEVDNYSPEDAYSTAQIYLLIEQLIEEYRIPFELYTDGFKYAEIAEQLEIPIGTVKSRIFQARKLLSEKIRA